LRAGVLCLCPELHGARLWGRDSVRALAAARTPGGDQRPLAFRAIDGSPVRGHEPPDRESAQPSDRHPIPYLDPTGGDTVNLLESLKRFSTVVADTGDIEAIAQHRPQDATTNPSLLLQAAQKPQYQDLVDDALQFALRAGDNQAARSVAFMDKLFIDFGC